jgi:small-conductance mechanosensitive channel
MSDEFNQGDRVKWNSSQGEVEGTVKEKLTLPTEIKGHHVAASEDAPQYLVESAKTGQQAAHKAKSLKKVE